MLKNCFSENYPDPSYSIPINSIINDGMYITGKRMTIYNNLTVVEYVIQENFIIQNEDIRLPVEFERFKVPYEYVERSNVREPFNIYERTKQ